VEVRAQIESETQDHHVIKIDQILLDVAAKVEYESKIEAKL
jgi:hypothetical protein